MVTMGSLILHVSFIDIAMRQLGGDDCDIIEFVDENRFSEKILETFT